MDFSSLLGKEIDRKRRAQSSRPGSKGTTKESEAQSEPTPKSDPKKPPSAEDTFLENIDHTKLTATIAKLLPQDTSEASKEEQLRKLEILVRSEEKDKLYRDFLERESQVSVVIARDEICPENAAVLALQVRRFLKDILARWQARPADSGAGTSAILAETKKDIVRLLYKLRSGKLPADMVVSLLTIVYYLQHEQPTQASQLYLELSIGNVAWPIGVRDVGIHARAADAKIAGDNKQLLANVMKSDATRRWLVAVKRIINYCAQAGKEQQE